MNEESNIGALYGALAKAQSEMPTAVFNKVNPHYRNKYADLASLREATLSSLSKHGLCIMQYTGFHGDNFVLFTRLGHTSGAHIEGMYPLPMAPDKPQVMGSAQTYARRYGWGAIVGEASDDDDDAEAATPRKSAHKARKDGDWEVLVSEMKECKTPEELQAWGKDNRGRISELPDNWQTHLQDEYARLMGLMNPDHPLKRRGRPPKIKEQLKASLAEATTYMTSPTVGEAIDDEIPDPDAFMDDISSQLVSAKTLEEIAEIEAQYEAKEEGLFPPDRQKMRDLRWSMDCGSPPKSSFKIGIASSYL